MSRINELLSRNNETMMFVTYFLGILDVRTGEVRYTNAGHNPPCIRRAGGALELLSTRHGPALGVVPARFTVPAVFSSATAIRLCSTPTA